jgi:hypothetical protein
LQFHRQLRIIISLDVVDGIEHHHASFYWHFVVLFAFFLVAAVDLELGFTHSINITGLLFPKSSLNLRA